MAVTSLATTATDKLFLEYILPGLNVEIRENTVLYDRFETDSDSVLGKYAVFKCLTASPKSARPSSSSSLPTAKSGTYDEFILHMKRGMYAQLQFDGLAVACGKGKGAVMELIKSETQAILIYIANKLNKQFWGDGSGRLAQLYAANSNDTSITVDGPLFGQDSSGRTDPATYLAEGMDVDIRHSTTGALEAEEVEITTIADQGDGTADLTMAENVTASSDAYIFDHDTYASSQAAGTGVPQGLRGIVAVADPYTGVTQRSFQNIDRDTYTWARGQEVDMASAAVTNQKMLESVMKGERYGRIKVIITNDVIWRAYYEILETDKTMPNEPAMWGGVSGISFYGGRSGKIPVIYDTDCPDQDMYFLDTDYLQVYSPFSNGMAWLPGDNGILTRVQGKDESTASLVWYYNFGTTKPQALVRLYDIKHASS